MVTYTEKDQAIIDLIRLTRKLQHMLWESDYSQQTISKMDTEVSNAICPLLALCPQKVRDELVQG
jgi:hypothetical protein